MGRVSLCTRPSTCRSRAPDNGAKRVRREAPVPSPRRRLQQSIKVWTSPRSASLDREESRLVVRSMMALNQDASALRPLYWAASSNCELCTGALSLLAVAQLGLVSLPESHDRSRLAPTVPYASSMPVTPCLLSQHEHRIQKVYTRGFTKRMLISPWTNVRMLCARKWARSPCLVHRGQRQDACAIQTQQMDLVLSAIHNQQPRTKRKEQAGDGPPSNRAAARWVCKAKHVHACVRKKSAPRIAARHARPLESIPSWVGAYWRTICQVPPPTSESARGNQPHRGGDFWRARHARSCRSRACMHCSRVYKRERGAVAMRVEIQCPAVGRGQGLRRSGFRAEGKGMLVEEGCSACAWMQCEGV